MRELKVIAKNTFLNEKHKLLIAHQSLSIINLETDFEASDSTCREDEEDVSEIEEFVEAQKAM